MKPKAILLGALVDNIGTLVGAWLTIAAATAYYSVVAADQDPYELMQASTAMHGLMFLLGTLYTVVGGYVCGRYSRGTHIYRNAAVMGLISTAVGAQSAMPSISLAEVAMLSTTLPAALAGAWLSVVFQKRLTAV